MAVQTTATSTKAWAPDIRVFSPDEAVPDALIFNATTVVTQELEGDAPQARIPWVDDDEAEFVAEGEEIQESDPELAETVVSTKKLSKLIRISREQWQQEQTSRMLSTSSSQAIIKRANRALLTEPVAGAGELAVPTGLIHVGLEVHPDAITEATGLDPLADTLGQLEANGASQLMIIADPIAWSQLRKLKTTTKESLLGAGVADLEKRLFGIPVTTVAGVPDLAGQLLVVDKSAIPSAVGQVQVAASEHTYFESDSIALRTTWRIGWKVAKPERCAIVNVQIGEDVTP